MIRHVLTISVVALFLAVSIPAFAVTQTATMAVSATITTACTLTTAALTFPSTSSGGVTAQSNITVNCVTGVPYFVAIDAGGTPMTAGRGLTGGEGATIPYELYRDAARTQIWGDLNYGDTYVKGTVLSGTANGSAQAIPCYGKLIYTPAGGGVAAGVYTDTVNVSITY